MPSEGQVEHQCPPRKVLDAGALPRKIAGVDTPSSCQMRFEVQDLTNDSPHPSHTSPPEQTVLHPICFIWVLLALPDSGARLPGTEGA